MTSPSLAQTRTSADGFAHSRDAMFLFILALAWTAAVALIGYRGDFPIVDDWAYAVTVKALVEQHRLVFSDWIATNGLTNALWGSLFAAIFGFSFETLRLSSLVAGGLGGAALYAWARQAGGSPALALVAAFCLMFNPIYFSLSFSFMTDVPFTALMTIGMVLIARSTWGGSTGSAIGGWVVALGALLMRQVGLAVPLAYAAAGILTRRPTWRSVTLALLPALGFLLVQRAYAAALSWAGVKPELYDLQSIMMRERLAGPLAATIEGAAAFLLYILPYFGLFLLPLAALFVVPAYQGLAPAWRRGVATIVVTLTLAVAVTLLVLGHPMPVWHDTLTTSGVGVEGQGPAGPYLMWAVLTVVGCFTGWALLAALITHLLRWRDWAPAMRWTLVYAGGTAGILAVPIAFIIMRFDRYLLPMLPCLIIVQVVGATRLAASLRAARVGMAAAWLVIVPMAGFSVLATHDYMASRTVHDAAVRDLIARGIPSERIDAGWVLNGYRHFGRIGRVRDLNSWVEARDYLVATLPKAGYDIVESRPVTRWLPWAIGQAPVLVQRSSALR